MTHSLIGVLDAEDFDAFDVLFEQASAIGRTAKGGLHRLAASTEDGAARDLLCDWLSSQGLEVRIDQVGNLFGLAELTPGAPYLMCGSHLDSQPTAGRFDGAYGVVAGALAIARLARAWCAAGTRPRFNLALVNWTNEEGARFQPSLIGSSVFTGSLTAEQAWACRDRDGISLGEALHRIGYRGDAPVTLSCAGYVEIHAEQGVALERSNADVGVVRRTWAALKLLVEFEGAQAHTGPTPMAERRDALLAAAQAIVLVRELADAYPGRLHSSVGRLEVYPNSPNVVPAKAQAFVEFRSEEPELLQVIQTRFESALAEIAAATGTRLHLLQRQLREALPMHEGLATLAHAACAELGATALDCTTVSGHDAISLARVAPSLLLFVPSQGGIAHHEAEFTSAEQMHTGLAVLTRVLARAAEGEGVLSDIQPGTER